MGSDNGVVFTNWKWAYDLKNLFNGREIYCGQDIWIYLASFFKEPADRSRCCGKIRFPVGIGQLPGAVLECFLDRKRRGDVAFKLTVGNVDVLKIHGDMWFFINIDPRLREDDVWVFGSTIKRHFGVGAGKAAVCPELGVVLEEEDICGRFFRAKDVAKMGDERDNKKKSGNKQ